jgi:hypothetical protein
VTTLLLDSVDWNNFLDYDAFNCKLEDRLIQESVQCCRTNIMATAGCIRHRTVLKRKSLKGETHDIATTDGTHY